MKFKVVIHVTPALLPGTLYSTDLKVCNNTKINKEINKLIVLLLKFTVVQKHIIHESEVLNMGYIFSLRKKKWLF